MAAAARHTVVCLGVIAYALTAVCAPVEAVLCLGSSGHIAIEPKHDGCRAHGCNDDTGINMKPEPTTVVVHHCCIDIPLPTAELRPCTAGFERSVGNPGHIEAPCAQPVDLAAIARRAPAIDGIVRASDPPTATIVLLI
jgi:hypothetical protein